MGIKGLIFKKKKKDNKPIKGITYNTVDRVKPNYNKVSRSK